MKSRRDIRDARTHAEAKRYYAFHYRRLAIILAPVGLLLFGLGQVGLAGLLVTLAGAVVCLVLAARLGR